MDEKPLTVQIGYHIEIELITAEGLEHLTFDIVPDSQADFASGFLGEGTPLAQALLNQSVGISIPYQTGDIQSVRILNISPSKITPPEDIEARRKETLRKAVEKANRTDAMIFASSFSGKWGDYDPEGIDNWD